MMNLKQYREKIRKILFDEAAPSASRWGDDDLNRFINEALLEISRAARRVATQDLSFAAGEDTKALPADLRKLDGYPLWKGTDDSKKMELAPAAENYPRDDASGSAPEKYWLLDGSILVRPVPDVSGTVTLVYLRKFADLVNDTDEPEPEDVDGIIIAYGLWQALDFDGSPLAETWKEKFVVGITAWGQEEKEKYRRRPASITVVR